MKKLNKKGFTIVELVIVIAVIAILAAVLIPTFSGVVEKANLSAALQTARSTLTNALNMSSTASLQGSDDNGYHTVFVVDGYAFGYNGNQLEQIDYPEGTKILKHGATLSDGEYSQGFNSIAISSENFNTTELKINEDIKTIIMDSSDLKEVELDTISKVGDNYYINGSTALYLNSDFSKKAVVYTTFSFTAPTFTVEANAATGASANGCSVSMTNDTITIERTPTNSEITAGGSANGIKGAWVGILITLDTKITNVTYKGSQSYASTGFTQEDVNEAVSAGASGENTFVLWVNCSNTITQTAELSCEGYATKTLTIQYTK